MSGLDSPEPRKLQVRCPACGEATWYSTENRFRPFCSARCQGVDFGAWASENYRISQAPRPEDELDDSGS